MIDLHCHLLPGIDDGASSVEEALLLAKMAVNDGVSHMVLTPHVHPGRYENTVDSIEPVFECFKKELKLAGIPLSVQVAGEVRLTPEILPMFSSGQLPYIGGWGERLVLLLEFPHSHIPPGSDKLVKWLLDRGTLPMIAHPERNKGFLADNSKLIPFVEMGCLFQLTAMSVTGEFGEQAHKLSQTMLKNGWVSVIASDAHNQRHRPPLLSNAVAEAEKLVGKAEARRLVWENPAKIIGVR